ncbi:hypothetical protein MMC11_005795 [Xylographa trunciseda]|nr:hypothetical protein [Xylographa trunciseda]
MSQGQKRKRDLAENTYKPRKRNASSAAACIKPGFPAQSINGTAAYSKDTVVSSSSSWPIGIPYYESESGENPIPLSLVPALNQFLCFDISRRSGVKNVELLSEEAAAARVAANIAMAGEESFRTTKTPQSRAIAVVTAGAMGFFDTAVEAANEKTGMKYLVDIMANRYHMVADTDLFLRVLPIRNEGRSAIRSHWRAQMVEHFNQITSSVHAWNFAGLKRTINESGGIAKWRHSNRSQRTAFFKAIWQ